MQQNIKLMIIGLHTQLPSVGDAINTAVSVTFTTILKVP